MATSNYPEKGFIKLNKQHTNQMLTPLMHTCVCLLQSVKFGLGSDAGQRAVIPLHIPSFAQSESSRHFSVFDLNAHCAVQQGPWLGLEETLRWVKKITRIFPIHIDTVLIFKS